jgi:adenosylmethionine-8-amino-7-oxononanoate aminotransferase
MEQASVKRTNQEKDEAYVWHAMKPYNPKATMIANKAKGVWVFDEEGNRLLDAMSDYGVSILGMAVRSWPRRHTTK